MNQKIQQIIDLHSNKGIICVDFDSIEKYVAKFRNIQNEFIYVVDTINADILPINNKEDAIFNTNGFKIKELSDLYSQLHIIHFDKFLDLSLGISKAFFDPHFTISDENISSNITLSLYKSKSGETIMRKSYDLLLNDQGKLTHTIGHLSNVTHLFPTNNLRYQFNGPNAKIIYCCVNEILEFVEILSKRELMVLNLIGKGTNSATISEQLFISKHTVNTHRKNIIKKLEVNSSIQAYNKALDMGLFNGI